MIDELNNQQYRKSSAPNNLFLPTSHTFIFTNLSQFNVLFPNGTKKQLFAGLRQNT